jgi:predicted metal-dependent hydrolase
MIYDDRYLEYIELFNERDFYDCHEVLEDLWLDNDGPDRRFYQGLIHLASAFLLLMRGKFRGSRSRFASTLVYLAEYPEHFHGLDLAMLKRNAAFWLNELEAAGMAIYRDAEVPVLKLANSA